MKRFFILVSILGLVITGCAKKGEKEGQYLAKVGDITITKEDVKKKLEFLPLGALQIFEGEEGMNKLVDEFINQKVLYLEAKKRGLDKDANYIKEVEGLKKRIEDLKEQMLVQFLLEKELEDKVKVSDKEVRDFYEKEKANIVGKNGKPVEFNIVKGMISQKLSRDKMTTALVSYIDDCKKSYKIDKNKEAITALAKQEETKKEESKKEEPKKEDVKKEEPKKEEAVKEEKKAPSKEKPRK